MRVEKLLRSYYVGKTLLGTEFSDYTDLEYYKEIDVEPAVLPSKIVDVVISHDADGEFRLSIHLENGTFAHVYDNEHISLKD